MVDIVYGNYGECRCCDCMDNEYGLPTINRREYDMSITDPPFNIDLENNMNSGLKRKDNTNKEDEIFYDDYRPDYAEWCVKWHSELMRLCNRVLIHCGNMNTKMWYRITDPIAEFIYFLPFNTIITPIAWTGRYRTILVYANDKNEFLGRNGTYKLDSNVITKTQFTISPTEDIKHPCPLDYELVQTILIQLKPKTLIEPFLGSGTIAEACETLGIKWLAYEKNKNFMDVIQNRINRGIERNSKRFNNSVVKTTSILF